MLVRPAIVLAAVALAAGCSSGPGGGTGGAGTSSSGAGGSGPAFCADDPRVTAYHAGLLASAHDGAITIRFVDSDPSPPARGNDTFTIAITDQAGKPVEGATIQTKSYMPDHGHGSSTEPTSRPGSAAGEYVIEPVNLFMPGVWEITFTVDEKGGTSDAVLFTFCVDG